MQSDPRDYPQILIVEDNPSVVALMELVAERESDWQFTAVDSGLHAVEAWENENFDVILMDLRLPLMNGIEATKAIREQELRHGNRHTPIIAYSGLIDEAKRRECIDAGFDDFIFKPTKLQDVIDTISRHLPESMGSHQSGS